MERGRAGVGRDAQQLDGRFLRRVDVLTFLLPLVTGVFLLVLVLGGVPTVQFLLEDGLDQPEAEVEFSFARTRRSLFRFLFADA